MDLEVVGSRPTCRPIIRVLITPKYFMSNHHREHESAKKPVTILEITKRITFVNIFLVLTLWGVVEIQRKPRVGWAGTVLFGTMLVLSVIELCRLPRVLKKRVANDREALKPKRAFIGIGTFAVSLLLGLVGEWIAGPLNRFWPNFAIWLASFVSVAAFYPLRDMKEDYPTFTYWGIYAALCGFISLAFAHLANWLKMV